jgi:tetratricopeptide (TPR) repeat protein
MLPPEALAGALRDFLDGKGGAVDPLVAAHAAYYLSLEEDRAGQHQQARARRHELGLVNDLWLIGPFDGQGRGGLDQVFSVEEDLARPRAKECHPHKARELCWRRTPPEMAPQGANVLGGLLRPDHDAVAYAVAYVHSDQGRWAALRLGSPGPVKVWLNRRQVLSRDVVRPAGLDQDASVVWLPAGTSVLLLKTVVTSGAWNIFLRLTQPSGAALSGVKADGEAPASGEVGGGTGSRPPAKRELAELLRQRAERAGAAEAAACWLDYARALDLLRSQDSESKATESAAEQAAQAGEGSPALSLAAWELLGQVARDEDDARQALERALKLASKAEDRALVLCGLGDLAQRQHRPEAALVRWREALAADPGCVPAQLALAGEERQAGLLATATQRLASLPVPVRQLPIVIEARARALETMDRFAESEATLRTLWTVRRSDPDVLRDLAVDARRRGEPVQAADWYGQAARWRPELHYLVLDQARMLEGAGQGPAALTVLRQALARLPDEPRLHEELGRLLARAGQTKEAVASLNQALRLRPQQPALRRFVASLAPTRDARRGAELEDMARTHAQDGEALSRAALATPVPDQDQDPAVILLDHQVTRVHGNGLADRFVQRIVHLRTDRAARDNQEISIRYTPGEQEVEIREARIYRRSAAGHVEISQASGRDDREMSEPWYGLYYDARAQVVTFDSLRAGDVLEVQYTVADVAYQNDMADYFGDLAAIGDVLPKRRWDYTLIAPAQRPFYFNQPRVPGLKHQQEQLGNEVVTRWAAEGVARVDVEPAMPGITEVAPYLHISTYRDWHEVGRWYWALVADPLKNDAGVKKVAAEVTAGLRERADKVKALHRFVIEKTRYVGLEFGIHGYKPYPVSQVLLRRFGDCKDKALLLMALLRAVDIDAELVLLRTRRAGAVDREPASLAIFDHAITYIPGMDLYLDGTAEFAGMSELPIQDQGVMVLRVSNTGTVLARTPVLPASANRADRDWKIVVNRDGSARIDETVTIKGQAAQEWRLHYQTPGEREQRYAKVWNGRYAGTQLQVVDMDGGVEDRNLPVVVHAKALVPHMAQPQERGEFNLPSSSRETDLTQTYARLGTRRWPLVLGFPWQHQEVLHYRFPEGYRLLRAPHSRKLTSAFGSFEFEVKGTDGRSVTVRSLLSMERDRIAPGEYAEFRAFLRQIDNLLGQPLVMAEDNGL